MGETGEKGREERSKCNCPYCDKEIDEAFLYMCRACQVVIRYCSHCAIPVPKEAKVCPECKHPVD